MPRDRRICGACTGSDGSSCRLHRIVAPERDVIRGVARERDVVSDDAYRYFQDVGDHLSRVQDSIETYQDVAASVMDVYLSAQNNRMNEIMKQLTVVATIFMPLTLLSGIYGMNLLRGMWPPPEAWWSFSLVVGVDGGHRWRDGGVLQEEELVVEERDKVSKPRGRRPACDRSTSTTSTRSRTSSRFFA